MREKASTPRKSSAGCISSELRNSGCRWLKCNMVARCGFTMAWTSTRWKKPTHWQTRNTIWNTLLDYQCGCPSLCPKLKMLWTCHPHRSSSSKKIIRVILIVKEWCGVFLFLYELEAVCITGGEGRPWEVNSKTTSIMTAISKNDNNWDQETVLCMNLNVYKNAWDFIGTSWRTELRGNSVRCLLLKVPHWFLTC